MKETVTQDLFPASLSLQRATGANFTSYILIILIFWMPIASGLRGFSPELGRIGIALSDAVTLLLFIATARLAWNGAFLSIVVFLLAVSLAFIAFQNTTPEASALYQGMRKSILWLMAISIGQGLSQDVTRKILNSIFVVCIVICLYGIKQYFWVSEFDENLVAAQSASIYTNVIGGVARATSVLSSGFHLGMAGCLVIAFALCSRSLSVTQIVALLVIAFGAIIASYTRTFMIIGTFLVLFRVLLIDRRLLLLAAMALLFLVFALSFFDIDVIAMIVNAATGDTRFANRNESYTLFNTNMGRYPAAWIMGFGPGSAGSTLGAEFQAAGAVWIEPHNIFTKYIFEYGLPTSLMIFWCICRAALVPPMGSTQLLLSTSCIFILFISGLTITSVEAWPISLYIGITIGLLSNTSPQQRT